MTAAARRAVSGWFAATIATGSPMYRTRSTASTGWSANNKPYVLRPGTSAWVRTAATPGTASAALMSMWRIRALAYGLRRVVPHSMPAAHRSEE